MNDSSDRVEMALQHLDSLKEELEDRIGGNTEHKLVLVMEHVKAVEEILESKKRVSRFSLRLCG